MISRVGVQDRPCTRCIKRNIGHLCHDEPREPSKRSRSDHEHSNADEENSSAAAAEFANVQGMPRSVEMSDAAAGQQIIADGALNPNSAPSVPNPTTSADQGLVSNSQQRMSGQVLLLDCLQSATTDMDKRRVCSLRIQRLARRTKPISRYAFLSPILHVQRSRSHERVQSAR